ncbi:MAG: tRNA pseudouridine(38-40) synthase TruA [Selenomonadaceae bacterium]|nr:tRNA pseudouridine(38-40) synthase TruA [Selenomonadaceae bacterium]
MKPEHKEMMKARSRNLWLRVAYDGTDYHGFQRQIPPVTAVQNVLEEALGKICGELIELTASGRTDAGVHARGQIVNFFTDSTIPVDRLPAVVNRFLPGSIVVTGAGETDDRFSALHSLHNKTYSYRLTETDGYADPFRCRYSWQIDSRLDMSLMQQAADLLLGEHDFSSFRATGSNDNGSPVKTVYTAELTRQGNDIELRIAASGFLYHMVRNIVGALVKVGEGRLTVEDFAAVIAAKDRNLLPPMAPASGLCMERVTYRDYPEIG